MKTRLPLLVALAALLATSACRSLIIINGGPVPPTAGDATPAPPGPSTAPGPTPSPGATPTPEPTATHTPGPDASPPASPSPSSSPLTSPRPDATPSAGPTPSPQPTAWAGATPTPWPSVAPTPTVTPGATPTPPPSPRLAVVKTIGKARSAKRIELKPGTGELVAPNPGSLSAAQTGTLASLTDLLTLRDAADPLIATCFADGKRYDLMAGKIAWAGGSVALGGEVADNAADIAVRGGQAYLVSKSLNCLFRVDLATGTATAFSGTPSIYGGLADGPTAAAAYNQPNALVAAPDALYVADTFNRRIRKVTYEGVASTVAGGKFGHIDGPADKAGFMTAWDLTRDDAGMLYVADQGAHAIRRVAPDGTVSTLAGSGTAGSTDGVGPEATFYFPSSLGLGAVAGTPALVVGQSDGKLRIVHGW